MDRTRKGSAKNRKEKNRNRGERIRGDAEKFGLDRNRKGSERVVRNWNCVDQPGLTRKDRDLRRPDEMSIGGEWISSDRE